MFVIIVVVVDNNMNLVFSDTILILIKLGGNTIAHTNTTINCNPCSINCNFCNLLT